jgi:DNA-binding CsgD family transcriptional regulator
MDEPTGGPIFGRGRELAQARAALVSATAAASGAGHSGRLLLVSGDPGMGKTRFVMAIAEMADEYHVPVAIGRAIDDAGMPPLWPFREAARSFPPLRQWNGLGEGATVSGAAASPEESAAARFAMFSAACEALAEAAAERGLVLVLEDLQWADRSSLLLLRQLAGALSRTRLLVVATFRESAGPPLAELLPGMLRADGVRPVRLQGLTRPEVAQWLRQLGIADSPGAAGDAAALAERLHTRTGGNPLFVRLITERGADAIDAGLSGVPELRRLILADLDGLAAPARELLDAASVLGERIELPLLADVTGIPADAARGYLDQAVARRILAQAPDSADLAFTHALVRDAIYEELAPSRRAALHGQAARVLERLGDGGASPGQIATHWHRSGGPDGAARSLRWARQAARSATAALAHDEAARFAALALHAAAATPEEVTLVAKAELTLDVARAEFTAGHVEASLAHCQAAARLAGSMSVPDASAASDRAGILAAAALVVTGIGDPETSAAVDLLCARAVQALAELQALEGPSAGDAHTATRARIGARQAIFAAETGACDRARDLSRDALAEAERSGDPDALLDGMHARHLALSAPQFLDERRSLATRACEIARQARQPLAELWGHVWLVDAAFQAGDLAEVDKELASIEQLASFHRQPLAWWHLHRLRATRSALVGDLAEAVSHNEAARAVALQTGAVSTVGMYHAFLHQLALLRGTLDPPAGQASLAMFRAGPAMPLVRVFIPLSHALLGDTDLARVTFEEFRQVPGTVEVGPRWAALMLMIGIGAVMLNDPQTGDRVYQEVAGLTPSYMGDGSGTVFSGGSTQRPIGDLALLTGRIDEAIRRYEDAITMNARIGARPFLALSRLGLARALLARANPKDWPRARALVTEAAAEFRRLDLPGPVRQADATLREIDAAARAASPLSPRESEIAALIAEAKSNRQIADQLVLSERTVEAHVRSILSKLGFTTRTEVATWLLRGSRLARAARARYRIAQGKHHGSSGQPG